MTTLQTEENNEKNLQSQTKNMELLFILTGGLWYMMKYPTDAIKVENSLR